MVMKKDTGAVVTGTLSFSFSSFFLFSYDRKAVSHLLGLRFTIVTNSRIATVLQWATWHFFPLGSTISGCSRTAPVLCGEKGWTTYSIA